MRVLIVFAALTAIVRAQDEEPRESAGPPRAASLTAELATATPERRFLVLLDLTRAYEGSDPARADDYLKQARAAARTPEETLRADAREAALLVRRGDFPAALRIARPAADRAREAGAGAAEFNALITLGDILRNMSDYDAALESYQSALEVGRRLGRTTSLAQAETGLGIVHIQLRALSTAETHLRRSLELTKSPSARLARAWALNTLGIVHVRRGEIDEARRVHSEALALRRQAGSRGGEADSMTNLALVEFEAGRPAEARSLLEEAITINVALRRKSNEVLARLDLVRAVLLCGEPGRAAELLDEVWPMVEALDSPRALSRYHERREQVAEARGDFSTALESARAKHRLQSEATGEEVRLKAASLQIRYELARHEATLAKEQARSAEQAGALQEAAVAHARTRTRLVSYAALLGVIATAAIAGLVILRARRRADRRALAETQAAQRAAEEAAALKTRLLRVASHDLKTPLAALQAAAAQMAADARDPAAVSALAGAMRAEAARMGGLVRDFLDATTIESGRLELRRSAVDLPALAAEVVADRQGTAALKRQTLTLQAPAAPLPAVDGDPDRLRQVLENLIGNALKFTPSGGKINVRPAVRGAEVAVEIEDNGPGLAPQDFSQLFQPYAQLSARPTGTEGSTGLGLSIAHELVARHGGRIVVDSAPGAGATFTVLLPVALSTA